MPVFHAVLESAGEHRYLVSHHAETRKNTGPSGDDEVAIELLSDPDR